MCDCPQLGRGTGLGHGTLGTQGVVLYRTSNQMNQEAKTSARVRVVTPFVTLEDAIFASQIAHDFHTSFSLFDIVGSEIRWPIPNCIIRRLLIGTV